MGPLVVLPFPRSGPLPDQDLPPVLKNILKPRLYGSQWRSGIQIGNKLFQQPSSSRGFMLTSIHLLDQKAPLPHPPAPDQEEPSEDSSGEELKSNVKCSIIS